MQQHWARQACCQLRTRTPSGNSYVVNALTMGTASQRMWWIPNCKSFHCEWMPLRNAGCSSTTSAHRELSGKCHDLEKGGAQTGYSGRHFEPSSTKPMRFLPFALCHGNSRLFLAMLLFHVSVQPSFHVSVICFRTAKFPLTQLTEQSSEPCHPL